MSTVAIFLKLSSRKNFQLDHTSDLKVEIYGRDLPELFDNACSCMFDVMLDRSRLDEVKSSVVRIESPDESELFLDWLREILFLFSSKSLAVVRVDGMQIETGTPCRLTAPFFL